jgi:hypothetical protein
MDDHYFEEARGHHDSTETPNLWTKTIDNYFSQKIDM